MQIPIGIPQSIHAMNAVPAAVRKHARSTIEQEDPNSSALLSYQPIPDSRFFTKANFYQINAEGFASSGDELPVGSPNIMLEEPMNPNSIALQQYLASGQNTVMSQTNSGQTIVPTRNTDNSPLFKRSMRQRTNELGQPQYASLVPNNVESSVNYFSDSMQQNTVPR